MKQKTCLLFFLLLVFLSGSLPAMAQQNVRYSVEFPSVSSSYAVPFLVANVPPNSPVLSWCNHPSNQGANIPCTNYATTYTELGVACPNGAQDTPDPQPSPCQSTGDAQGNIGVWAPPGTYDYVVCIQNSVSCFGPYTVTLGASGSGTGSGANKTSFDQCSPGETTHPGNAAWTTTNFGGSIWDAGHWEFVAGATADIFCSIRIPSNLNGTPHIILDFFSANTTPSNTVAFSTCDATTTAQQLNVGSLTCAASQNYVPTATAYSMTELSFAVQSSPVVDQYLIVNIHQASGGSPTVMMEPPKLKVF